MNVPKIRFETFTEEWRKTSVGQVAHIIGGGTPSTSNIHYWGEIFNGLLQLLVSTFCLDIKYYYSGITEPATYSVP